jgi:hypothetical protein
MGNALIKSFGERIMLCEERCSSGVKSFGLHPRYDEEKTEVSTEQLFANLKRAILHFGKQFEQHTLIPSDIENMCREFVNIANHLNDKDILVDLNREIFTIHRKYIRNTLNYQDVVKLFITFADFSYSIDDIQLGIGEFDE